MRAVVTRVSEANVKIEGKTVGQIGKGFLVLLGVGEGDTEENAKHLAEKIAHLRVFSDKNGKMNLALKDVEGELLIVSQFTLYADLKSRRPGFTKAAKAELAEEL
ncbi:MAG: D-tyrosyl-tRNA(Tyr) deacylase, partial [Selenomonadaceae bacterium]|nr:D-tyrosyl-tRNA(Tyr) deacylase [Selenomonadaceae bacterium]